MKTERSRVHHVVGLVWPDNFQNAVSRMSQGLRTAFYGPFERTDIGIRIAISMDAGVELITPLSNQPDDPMIQSLTARGEHWTSVIFAVRDLDGVVGRLGELGHQPVNVYNNIPGDYPGGMPFADDFTRLDEISFAPQAFGGLPVVVAAIDERECVQAERS